MGGFKILRSYSPFRRKEPIQSSEIGLSKKENVGRSIAHAKVF